MDRKAKSTILPPLIVGPSDVARLRRELEALDEYIRQADLRAAGESTPKLPRTSRLLDEFSTVNNLNLLQKNNRDSAIGFFNSLAQNAPVLQISFTADPSAAFTVKLMTWLRQNIHPLVLLRIGLQPNIAAGCIVKTTNHYYDFSLRQRFVRNKQILLKRIQALNGTANERQ